MVSNLRAPQRRSIRSATTKERPKRPPLTAFKRFVEDDTIRRVSQDEYRAKVMDVYGGPQGAMLAPASMVSLHLPLTERLFRSRKFDRGGMKSILDVGSGAGQLAQHVIKYGDADAEVTCIDLSQPMLRRAPHRLKGGGPALVVARRRLALRARARPRSAVRAGRARAGNETRGADVFAGEGR